MTRLGHSARAALATLWLGCALTLPLSASPLQGQPGKRGGLGDTVPPGTPGSYRGPGDTAPRPRRAQPAPRPPAASTGPEQPELSAGFGTPFMTAPMMCSGAQFAVPVDPSVWQLWWRHNRHAYLDLKTRLHTTSPESGSDTFFLGQGDKLERWDALVPSENQKREDVIPALLEVLGTAHSPTLHREALLALARIAGGGGRGPSPYALVFETYLDDQNLFLVEAATVALGILGDDGSLPSLLTLLEDSPRGRSLVDSTSVPTRVRACAAYALGLLGSRSASSEVRQDIVQHLVAVLNAPHFATRDIKVAAMIALGATPLELREVAPDDPSWTRRRQLEFLLDYFDPALERANRTTRHRTVRAHAATAIGRLAQGAPEDLRARAAELLLAPLAVRSPEPDEVRQGCVLALGALGDADAAPGSVDAHIRATLIRTAEHGDPQSRRFALLSLAQSGARPGQEGAPSTGLDAARAALLEHLAHGESQVKPWAALALGVMGHALQRHAQPVDAELIEALRRSCADNRRPAEGGAHMLALGLLQDTESIELLTQKLEFFSGSDEARGMAAIALGLTRAPSAQAALHVALESAAFRPALAADLGVGLRLCGDTRVVPQLARGLEDAAGFGSQAPIVGALGQAGDSRAIPALVTTLRDETVTDWTRALVAAALGSICDKDPLPWTARLSSGVLYTTQTATLTTLDSLGVLDYL